MRRELESMAEAYGGHSLSQSYIKKADASEVTNGVAKPNYYRFWNNGELSAR
jgi:hypothetical protein